MESELGSAARRPSARRVFKKTSGLAYSRATTVDEWPQDKFGHDAYDDEKRQDCSGRDSDQDESAACGCVLFVF
jgi:hypothetical protein